MCNVKEALENAINVGAANFSEEDIEEIIAMVQWKDNTNETIVSKYQ